MPCCHCICQKKSMNTTNTTNKTVCFSSCFVGEASQIEPAVLAIAIELVVKENRKCLQGRTYRKTFLESPDMFEKWSANIFSELPPWLSLKKRENKPMCHRQNPWGIQTDRDLHGILQNPAWNLLLGTLELHASFTWNPYLELWNLLEASLGTCLEPWSRNPYAEQWNLHSELWLRTSEPRQTSTRNLQNLLGTLEFVRTLTWNFGIFGTFWNLHLEPLLRTSWNLTSEPLETFTWNFGTSWILYLEPWLGTWEPLGTLTWNP